MSTHNLTSTSVEGYSSRELDDFGLNNTHHPTTPFDNNLLSPNIRSHTISNSASPSYNPSGTPGESEHRTYQPSEFSEVEDPFFGVNFDDGVQRIDSGLSITGFQASGLSRSLQNHPPQTQNKPSSATFSTAAYPLRWSCTTNIVS